MFRARGTSFFVSEEKNLRPGLREVADTILLFGQTRKRFYYFRGREYETTVEVYSPPGQEECSKFSCIAYERGTNDRRHTPIHMFDMHNGQRMA